MKRKTSVRLASGLGLSLLLPMVHASAQEFNDALPPLNSLLKDVPTSEQLFVDFPKASELTKYAVNGLPKRLQETPNWVRQKRLAALFPILRVSVYEKERNRDRSEILRDPSRENRTYSIDVDDSVEEYDEMAISLSWDLAEFVFHQDHLDAAGRHIQLAEYRQKIQEKIVSSYVELKSSMLLLAQEQSLSAKDRIKHQVSSEEHRELLDLYTGDMFTKLIKHNRKLREGGDEPVKIPTPENEKD